MRLYEDHAYHFERPVESHWQASAPPLGLELTPLHGVARADVAIIGAGYTGLHAAYRLAHDYGLQVVVLEAGEPGWGASGRNGGFCCVGSAKLGYDKMIQRYGLAATVEFHQAQKAAVEHVAGFLAAHNIDAERCIDGEMALAHKPNRMSGFHREAAFMRATFGDKMEVLDVAALRERGYYSPAIYGGLFSHIGFGLHPLKYVRGLARLAASAGVIIHPRSEVTGWQMEAGRHRLKTARGEISAAKVLVASNGYGNEMIPPWLQGRLLPALSRVMVTRPLHRDELAAQGWTNHHLSYDSRKLLHYFRLLPDNRFLFGGRGGTLSSEAGLHQSGVKLRARFEQMFPAWADVESEKNWAGLVCLTRGLVPCAGGIEGMEGGYFSLAYHGNGVAMASYAGTQMATIIGEGKQAADFLPQIMCGSLRKFPMFHQRINMLRAIYAKFLIEDKLF